MNLTNNMDFVFNEGNREFLPIVLSNEKQYMVKAVENNINSYL